MSTKTVTFFHRVKACLGDIYKGHFCQSLFFENTFCFLWECIDEYPIYGVYYKIVMFKKREVEGEKWQRQVIMVQVVLPS